MAKRTPKQKVLTKHQQAKCTKKPRAWWYVAGHGAYGIFIDGWYCIGRGRNPAAAWRDASNG